jgi:hypothetical protein
MRFVDDEMTIAQGEQLVHDTHDLFEWRDIAIHAIHCLYSNENIAMSSFDSSMVAKQLFQSVFQRSSRIVSERKLLAGSGETHAIVHRGVNELIIHNSIAWLW